MLIGRLELLGHDNQTREALFRVVSAVLAIGNITFKEAAAPAGAEVHVSLLPNMKNQLLSPS